MEKAWMKEAMNFRGIMQVKSEVEPNQSKVLTSGSQDSWAGPHAVMQAQVGCQIDACSHHLMWPSTYATHLSSRTRIEWRSGGCQCKRLLPVWMWFGVGSGWCHCVVECHGACPSLWTSGRNFLRDGRPVLVGVSQPLPFSIALRHVLPACSRHDLMGIVLDVAICARQPISKR